MSLSSVVAIIPARGGSKGVPRKNVKLLAGKPLIAYIILSAFESSSVDRVIVSTDDEEIAAVAKKYGAEVIMRPAELAGDEVPTLPVLQQVLMELKSRGEDTPEYTLLVYPTSPLLHANRIKEAVDLVKEHNADSVISGTYDKGHYWQEVGNGGWTRVYPTELKNRQLSKPLFKENGAIYLTRSAILLSGDIVAKETGILVMEPDENVDIDTLADFAQAEELMLKKKF